MCIFKPSKYILSPIFYINLYFFKCIKYSKYTILACGRIYTTSHPVSTIDSKKALTETAPWNVGIYRLKYKNDINYDLICGGSLIAPTLVISGK